MDKLAQILAPVSGALIFVFFMITVVVHLLFAAGVAQSANRRVTPTQLVPGIVWAIATLGGGVLVATAYWLIHSSNLAREARAEPEEVWTEEW